MKIPTEDIFHLIKSLTKSEKRYFKLQSGLYRGDKLYLRLFDEIAKQNKYDEQLLLSALKLRKQKKWFSFLKMRLYDLLSRSLEDFHYNNYSGSAIRNYLNRYDIFFRKGLYSQCQIALTKAKSMAIKYEVHHTLLEILDNEYRLNMLLTKKPAVLKHTHDQSKKTFELVQQTLRYSHLFERLDIAYNEFGVTRNANEYKLMKSIFNNPLVKTTREPETFAAKETYFLIHTFKNYFEQNFEQMHQYAKRRADAYINNPHFIEYASTNYINSLNNVLISSLRTNNIAASEYYLKKLDELHAELSSEHDKKQAFISSLFGLKYFFQTSNYAKANTLTHKLIKELPTYENSLGLIDKTDFYANIFSNFFYAGNYHKAVFWLNKIRNFETPKFEREYFSNIFPITYLITHYEAGADKEFLNSLFQSTYRKIKNTILVFKLETILKDFFAEYLIPDAVPDGKILKAFLELKKILEKLSKDPVEKRVFLYFDFVYWVNLNIDKYSKHN